MKTLSISVRYTMRLPNGISEISKSLKCCFPNGMPMMVRQSKNPKKRCVSAVHQPPQIIQITLAGNVKQPRSSELLTTFWPKGQNIRMASLKHCRPNGMPIMVQHNATPPTTYPIAEIKPPNMSQIMLPMKFIPQI